MTKGYTIMSHREAGLGWLLHALIACMLIIGLGTAPSRAQTIDTVAAFDIPAQPMGTALTALAVQANVQIFFAQEPVAALEAPAVKGSMTGKEALEQLLAHSPLTFAQNADGTIVVTPKARKARRTPPPTAPVMAAQAPVETTAVPGVPAPMQSALQREGPWIMRARGVYVDPQNVSPEFDVGAPPAEVVPKNGTRSNQRFEGELDAEYFFGSNWSTELAVGIPHVHDFSLSGAGGNIGDFRLSPNFLTIKYGFLPDAAFRPYLGIGVNVMGFYDENIGPYHLSKVTAGPAAQGGFDVRLSDHWSLNADAKWAYARPELEIQGQSLARLKFDPVFVGVGLGYRFGGSPPPVTNAAPASTPVIEAPPKDSDGDGVPDAIDQCPNTPAGVKVDGRGCPLDSDQDGVPDYLDQCPGTPPGLKVDANGCEIEELVLKGVNFETASAILTAESSSVLDQVIDVLRQRPKAHAEIHGYTDSRGGELFNQKLSERRAKSVVDYFVAHGISADELSSRGFGKTNPVATNDTSDGRAQNRRVTVEFSRPVPRS